MTQRSRTAQTGCICLAFIIALIYCTGITHVVLERGVALCDLEKEPLQVMLHAQFATSSKTRFTCCNIQNSRQWLRRVMLSFSPSLAEKKSRPSAYSAIERRPPSLSPSHFLPSLPGSHSQTPSERLCTPSLESCISSEARVACYAPRLLRLRLWRARDEIRIRFRIRFS